jgi:hypothetical protein
MMDMTTSITTIHSGDDTDATSYSQLSDAGRAAFDAEVQAARDEFAARHGRDNAHRSRREHHPLLRRGRLDPLDVRGPLEPHDP